MFYNMRVEKRSLKEGAMQACGLVVVIDVFRAFSLACYAFHNGVQRIYPVDTVEKALKMKQKDSSLIAIGERNERKYPGFDFGNSPTHIEHEDFSGKEIVHTTSSGTQGIALATNADAIITGSFVNADAIVRYIQAQNPELVTLVPMGYEGVRPSDEDEFCAQYIANALQGVETPFQSMVEILRTGAGARLLDPANNDFSPARDFELCLNLSRFNFVLRVNRDHSPFFLERVDC
jgi:2-phosphosulfolactate phosphatase